jgi:PEP-CTERM motif
LDSKLLISLAAVREFTMSRQACMFLKVLALAIVLVWPAVSKADGFTENFDSLTPTLNATNLGAFTVTSGSVDVVGGSLYGYLCVPPESGNCVDLDGSTYVAGQISSASLTLVPGAYAFSFDLIGSQRGVDTSTTVTLGSLYNQTFLLSSGDDTSGIVNTIIVVGATTVAPLIFTSNTSGNAGALLDNVSVVSTPEPATLSLLGIGLASLMFVRRRATT